MSGLQLKSLMMATLQLECDFKTFPSKNAANIVPEFVDGATLDMIRQKEGENKHVCKT